MSALPNMSVHIDPFGEDAPESLYDQIEREIGDLAGKRIARFG
jgi:hypothetical protein